MTNAELIRKIRAEIERRIKLYSITNEKEQWIVNTYWSVLSFLDTLESEKPMQEGLEEEYKDYVEFDPVFSKLVNRNAGLSIARHFAQWQKEQMMKEAVEGEVMTNGFYPYEPRVVASIPGTSLDFGDKVRVIVLPKED